MTQTQGGLDTPAFPGGAAHEIASLDLLLIATREISQASRELSMLHLRMSVWERRLQSVEHSTKAVQERLRDMSAVQTKADLAPSQDRPASEARWQALEERLRKVHHTIHHAHSKHISRIQPVVHTLQRSMAPWPDSPGGAEAPAEAATRFAAIAAPCGVRETAQDPGLPLQSQPLQTSASPAPAGWAPEECSVPSPTRLARLRPHARAGGDEFVVQ